MTLILAYSGFSISDLHISSQVISEKNEVEAKWIKEGCKRGLIDLRQKIQGKTHEPKRSTKRGVRKSDEVGQPEATTARPWWLPRAAHGGQLLP